MPTLNTKIWMALRRRAETLDMRFPAVFTTAWPIAWPGMDYAPVAGVPFLAVGEVQSPPTRAMVDRNINNRGGTLTITPVMPLSRVPDPSFYKEAAGRVADHFQGQIRYDDICLRLASSSGATAYAPGGYRDAGWWREPVSIPWQVYA